MDAQIESKLIEFSGQAPESFKKLPSHLRNKHFEDFVAYHVLKHKHVRDIDKRALSAAMTGSTNDNQVDTLCVLVGDAIVRDPDHAVELLEDADDASITYVFIQTTTSKSFDQHKMVMFATGIGSYFKPVAYFSENEALRRGRAIKERIAAHLAAAEDTDAIIRSFVYYVALGRWTQAREQQETKDAKGWRRYAAETVQTASGQPNAAEVEVIDVDRLKMMISQNERVEVESDEMPQPVSGYARTIKAPHLTAIPGIEEFAYGYIGCIEASELIELLEREDGQGLLDTLSYSNVRAFLGTNKDVNAEIAATLASAERRQFVLRNNGVTFIASGATHRNGELRLENYQIVNGLQTSNILYQQRNHLDPAAPLYVPVKIVVTDKDDLKRAIVRSTNRQTAIPDLQHASQDPFVRALWQSFNERRAKGAAPLWFEHRAGEYDSDESVDDERVLTVTDLLTAMIATYLRQPHNAAGEAEMRKRIPGQVFNPKHRKAPYLVAALSTVAVREWLRRHDKDKTLARFEAHLLFGLMVLIEPDGPRLGLEAPEIETRCGAIEKRLDQGETVDKAITAVADTIRTIIAPFNKKKAAWRNLPRDKGRMTTPLGQRLLKSRKALAWR